MKSTETPRDWAVPLLDMEVKDRPMPAAEPELGCIWVVGTSNARRITEALVQMGYTANYIPCMKVDTDTVEHVLQILPGTKLSERDRIVLLLSGNSFLKSKNSAGFKSLNGSKDSGHLVDPEGLEDFELVSLVKTVARLAAELENRFPTIGKVVYGPLPRFMPLCCNSHTDTGKVVLKEIKRVDNALRNELVGLFNIRFGGALECLVPGEAGNPGYLEPKDPVHLSEIGRKKMARNILDILGRRE